VRGEKVDWNNHAPSKKHFDEIMRVSKNRIIWGANYFNCFEENGGAIVWVKNQPMPDFSKAEIASCSFHKRTEIFTKTWTNFVNTKQSNHPCERPVSLYLWCISRYTNRGQIIFDPFLGSGTTAIAAAQLGRNFIGIEINPEYCRIAEDRLRIETILQPNKILKICDNVELKKGLFKNR